MDINEKYKNTLDIDEKHKSNLETTIKHMLEEWEMYSTSISQKNLEYIEILEKDISKFKHKLDKLSGKKEHKDYDKEDKIKDTMVDERLENAVDEYGAYMAYKETYKKSKLQSDLDMAHQELGHYLQNLVDMFVEVEKCSKDIPEERSMIKAKIKEIYQMFN